MTATPSPSPARRSIAADTRWTLIAEVVRFTTGIGVFLLVARSLGPVDYGVFVALGAITTVVGPFANVGSSMLLVQRVQRDGVDPIGAYRTAVTVVASGGIVATVVTALLTAAVLDTAPVVAIVAVAIGELIFAAVTSLCSYAAMALGDLRARTALVVGAGVLRLVAAAVFLVAGASSVASWAVLQAGASALAAVAALGWTHRAFGLRPGRGRVSRADLSEGWPYAASIAAFSAQDGLDKPLMVRAGWADDAGWYAAAYRVPALAFMPVQALLVATVDRSFRAGRTGLASSIRLARRLLVPALAYAVAAGAVIAVAAPVFRPVLGDDFAGAVEILRWMAFLPVLRTLQYFPANALSGAGHQRARLMVLLTSLATNLVLCLVWIPDHSWRGALAATAVSETLYALLVWLVVAVRIRAERASVSDPA